MRRLGFMVCALAALTAAVWTGRAAASPFTTGNLVVSRMGDGTAALGSTGTAVFLDEYTTATGQVSPVQSLGMPTAASGTNHSFVDSGSATSDGALTLSNDGRYLTLAGYDAAVGTTGVASGTAGRVVARVAGDGSIDTSTVLTNIGGNNVRSAASTDGNSIWVASASGGVQYTTFGVNGAGTQVSTGLTNTRVVNIFNGQLYVSSMSGAFRGVNSVGTGTPTSAAPTTLLTGFSPATNSPQSVYDFFFADSSTLYVADDRATASSGGLEKWVLVGSTWTNVYTLTSGLTAGLRGLAGALDGAGNAVLYAVTADATNNKLVSISDQISATSLPGTSFSTLATAGTNEAFRGVDFVPAPVPEPMTLGLLGIGSLLMVFRRRRA